MGGAGSPSTIAPRWREGSSTDCIVACCGSFEACRIGTAGSTRRRGAQQRQAEAEAEAEAGRGRPEGNLHALVRGPSPSPRLACLRDPFPRLRSQARSTPSKLQSAPATPSPAQSLADCVPVCHCHCHCHGAVAACWLFFSPLSPVRSSSNRQGWRCSTNLSAAAQKAAPRQLVSNYDANPPCSSKAAVAARKEDGRQLSDSLARIRQIETRRAWCDKREKRVRRFCPPADTLDNISLGRRRTASLSPLSSSALAGPRPICSAASPPAGAVCASHRIAAARPSPLSPSRSKVVPIVARGCVVESSASGRPAASHCQTAARCPPPAARPPIALLPATPDFD
jgi:hypothetical protein